MYLLLTVYEPQSEFHGSDQITVPAAIWSDLDSLTTTTGPIFVSLGDTGLVGRIRPALPEDGLRGDTCRIPTWMWRFLGCPAGGDDESWISLDPVGLPVGLPVAGTLVLRAREEATVTGSADPVAMLTAALSGSTGLSWACLTVGSELPLSCGTFDIMELRDTDGSVVSAASILDCDVVLEFVPALDAALQAPALKHEEPFSPALEEPPNPGGSFVPFSGGGRRLGSS
jgi:hypothetical protein